MSSLVVLILPFPAIITLNNQGHPAAFSAQ